MTRPRLTRRDAGRKDGVNERVRLTMSGVWVSLWVLNGRLLGSVVDYCRSSSVLTCIVLMECMMKRWME